MSEIEYDERIVSFEEASDMPTYMVRNMYHWCNEEAENAAGVRKQVMKDHANGFRSLALRLAKARGEKVML